MLFPWTSLSWERPLNIIQPVRLFFLKTMINFPFVKDEYTGRLCIYNEPKGLYSFLPSAQEVVGSPRRLSYRYTRSNISDMQPVWQLLFHRVGYSLSKNVDPLTIERIWDKGVGSADCFPLIVGLICEHIMLFSNIWSSLLEWMYS
jgi:hypothetical protein